MGVRLADAHLSCPGPGEHGRSRFGRRLAMGTSRSSGVCCRPFLSDAGFAADMTVIGSWRMQVPLAKEHRDIEKAARAG